MRGRHLAVLAALLIAGCGDDAPVENLGNDLVPPFGEVEIRVTAADGTDDCACVLVADEPELRQRGLMHVTDLGDHAGMLFVFDQDVESRFFMRNTPMPLSIAWFDAGGELVSATDMDPCGDRDDCPRFSAAGPYRFALEVPQGELADLGITDGATLEVEPDCDEPA